MVAGGDQKESGHRDRQFGYISLVAAGGHPEGEDYKKTSYSLITRDF